MAVDPSPFCSVSVGFILSFIVGPPRMTVDPFSLLGAPPHEAVDPFSSLWGPPHEAVDLYSEGSSSGVVFPVSPVHSSLRSPSIPSSHSRTSLREFSVRRRSLRSSSAAMNTGFSELVEN